jgi:hypothetical protein
MKGSFPMEGAFSFWRDMNNSINSRKNAARTERLQQRVEAGSVATRFPEVANIVMNMTYSQHGAKSILRTLNFTPNSYAFFGVNCLRQDCVDGGFDLSQVITAMSRSRRVTGKGELNCKGTDSASSHSDIVYEVAIQYA